MGISILERKRKLDTIAAKYQQSGELTIDKGDVYFVMSEIKEALRLLLSERKAMREVLRELKEYKLLVRALEKSKNVSHESTLQNSPS